MRKLAALFAVLMLLCVASAYSQTKTVTGRVTDLKGDPVPYATIKIKGANTGVAADQNGNFSIEVNSKTTLTISAAGFEAQEVSVGDQSALAIGLKPSSSLEEVVITGAYNMKRVARGVSYNAQIVGGDQLNTIRQTDINNALAGKVAGIQVRSQSMAALGRQSEVRLRGADGFDLNSSGVIYVVDGTILPNITSINTDDIDDVTVLQGPAAAAQFGSQGANGAIVISLKKGKKTRGIGVTVNSGAQFDKVYILPNYQNAYAGGNVSDMYKYTWKDGDPEEWKVLDGKYYPDYSDDASWGPRMVGQEYIPWYSWYAGSKYSYTTASLNPQPNNARDFFNTGLSVNNNVSLSKTGDNYDLRMSYSNVYVNGIIPTSSLNKNIFNIKTTYKIIPKLKAGINLNYISSVIKGQVDDDNYSNQSTGSFNQWFHRDIDMGIMRELKNLRTSSGVYASWNHANPNTYDPEHPDNFYAANYWYNFYTWFDLVDQATMYERLFGDISLNYEIIPGLNIRGVYRKQFNTDWSEQKYHSELAQSGLQTTGNTPEALGFYYSSNSYSNRENLEFHLSYSKKVGDFDINVNAGTDFFKWTYKNNGGYTNNGLIVPNLFTASNSKNPATYFNNRIKEAYKAVYGVASLGFRNFLFVDGTLRNDWFSTLPSDNNSVLSKSLGASLVFSDLLKIPAISFGKLRASWGEVPQALGTSSTTFGAYRYPGLLYGVGSDQWNGNILMSTPDQLVDPNIRGAVKTTKEIGLDMKFLRNRVGFGFTYWDASSKDFPYAVSINGASGYTQLLTNAGLIKKNGIDVIVNISPFKNPNFKWDINATWSYLIKNDVIKITDSIHQTSNVQTIWGTTMPYLIMAEGKRWGQIYGNGIKRINGQPVINDNGSYVNDPAVFFGSVLPKYTGGLQNSFEIFKNFIVNVNIDFQVGGKFVSLSDMWGSYSGLTARTATVNDKGNPVRDAVADGGGIHVFGVDNDGKAKDVYMEVQDYYHGLYSNKTFDEFVYDLTFVKLRELSVGYRIPVNKINGIGNWVNGATFSVSARNPILIYAKTKDFDPSEITAATGETGQFPGTRSLGVNLKLDF
ncbi:MAG: SusC/RagA family TonB-linked outer membrane protein [Agriterribacter sp.]